MPCCLTETNISWEPASLTFCHEEWGSRFIQNHDKFLPEYMASHPRQQYSLYSLLRELQISRNEACLVAYFLSIM